MKIFEQTVHEILKPLAKNNIDYCIIGGLAIIAAGVRRGTSDFDIVISKEQIGEALDVIYKQGFKLITNIDSKKDKLFYCNTEIQAIAYVKMSQPKVIKINKGSFSGLFGDIWLETIIPFNKLMQNIKKYKLYDELINFADPNDLIELKEHASRPIDKQDIIELKAIKKKFSKKNVSPHFF